MVGATRCTTAPCQVDGIYPPHSWLPHRNRADLASRSSPAHAEEFGVAKVRIRCHRACRWQRSSPFSQLSTHRPLPRTGTETWYRHSIVRNVTYTEGVQYLAQRAGAYWLIHEIALANSSIKPINQALHAEEFQVWKLQRDAEGSGANLTVEDGNGHVIHQKRFEFTDFPLPDIQLWFVGGVALLPSEY